MTKFEKRVVEARVEFVSREDAGGISLFSGMQPSCLIGPDLIACRVERADGGLEIKYGETYDLVIVLAYGSVYDEYLAAGTPTRLQAGSRLLETGVLTKILPHENAK